MNTIDHHGPHTRQDAEQTITTALGDYADQHDVPAITDELRDLAGSWEAVPEVESETFWAVVQRHVAPDDGRTSLQAHADTDGLPPGQTEPEQGHPVTAQDLRAIFGLQP